MGTEGAAAALGKVSRGDQGLGRTDLRDEDAPRERQRSCAGGREHLVQTPRCAKLPSRLGFRLASQPLPKMSGKGTASRRERSRLAGEQS
mgnify:CR=1 FL=1